LTNAKWLESNTDGEDNCSTNSAELQEHLTRQAEERKVYVRRVSSRVYHRVRSTSTTPSAFPHLFQCILLVGLNLDPSDKKTKVPYIKTKYPLDVSECNYLEEVCQERASVLKLCWYN
jgi:GTP cyclohydrolase III